MKYLTQIKKCNIADKIQTVSLTIFNKAVFQSSYDLDCQ